MNEVYRLCEKIAAALNQAVPGVRCKLVITLDGTAIKPQDVIVKFRPPPRPGSRT